MGEVNMHPTFIVSRERLHPNTLCGQAKQGFKSSLAPRKRGKSRDMEVSELLVFELSKKPRDMCILPNHTLDILCTKPSNSRIWARSTG